MTHNTMKSLLKFSLMGLLALAITALPLSSLAQTTNSAPATENQPPAEKKAPATHKKQSTATKSRPIPFQGTLTGVDPVAKTLTVGQRTFQITSATKLFLADKKTPATLDAATVNQHVSGSYRKGDDGKLTALSVYLGDKTEPKAAKPEKTGKAKKTE